MNKFKTLCAINSLKKRSCSKNYEWVWVVTLKPEKRLGRAPLTLPSVYELTIKKDPQPNRLRAFQTQVY